MKIGRIAVLAAIASAWVLGVRSQTLAEEGGAASSKPVPAARAASKHPFPRSRRTEGSTENSGLGSGLWLGGAGFALALFGLGAAVLSTRRRSTKPGDETTVLRVAGRVALSPRQAVHLLKVGDRTILIGTGTQGPPSFLGEWTDSVASPPKPSRTRGEGEMT